MGFFDGFDFGDALGAAASIGGSLISANAARSAADVQAQAAGNATQVDWDIYRQNREDLTPFRDVGQNALYQLAALEGVDYEGAPGTTKSRMDTAFARFVESPDYQFGFNEGVEAIDRSAAARGRLQSGATLKALNRYGQDYASTRFGDYKNSLARLGGVGQTATNTGITAANQTAGNVGNALMQAGGARASGYAGTANAINQGIENLLYLGGR